MSILSSASILTASTARLCSFVSQTVSRRALRCRLILSGLPESKIFPVRSTPSFNCFNFVPKFSPCRRQPRVVKICSLVFEYSWRLSYAVGGATCRECCLLTVVLDKSKVKFNNKFKLYKITVSRLSRISHFDSTSVFCNSISLYYTILN